MKVVSNAYKMAMAKPYRDHAFMIASIGIISNAAQSSAKIISETSYLSNNVSLFGNAKTDKVYATFEQNQARADGNFIFPPKDDEYFQLASVVSALSKDIMGSITLNFDNAYDIKGLTIEFGEYYPTSFNIIINRTDSTTYTNDAETFVTEDLFNDVQTITITPLSFDNGDKRLRIQSMKMGVGIVFTNDDIESARIQDSTSFISDELPHLDYKLTCFDRRNVFNVDDDNSFLHFLRTGQEITNTMGIELEDGTVEWVEMPPTYLTKWASNDRKLSIQGADIFRVFLGMKYEDTDGLEPQTLYSKAEKVLQAAGLEPDEYYIDDILRNITITNPLPSASISECLQLIANAGRCALKQDNKGKVSFIPNFENIIDPTDLVVTTNDAAVWSEPSNIRTGSTIVYADFTRNFATADGTMYFIPESGNEYLESGFVTRDIADFNGDFETTPSLEITLPAAYTYFGMYFEFAGNPPLQFTVKSYKSNELIDTVTVTNPTLSYALDHAFYGFDKMVIEFDKASPKNRVVLQRVSYAGITDYRLTKADMEDNPVGVMETKVKELRVRIFSFEEVEREIEGGTETSIERVDDEVYYTYQVDTVGETITFENQLIGTEAHAEQVAEWIANYYANHITYTVPYRGDPRIESADYLYMDSDVVNNLQVEVDMHTLDYNGAFSGKLQLRRAIDMVV